MDSKKWTKSAATLREHHITNHFKITPLPFEAKYSIHMDKAVFNINVMNNTSTAEISLVTDPPQARQETSRLTYWSDIFEENPRRIMLCGKRSSGKTMLLKKISYDWATKHVSNLKIYQLVFYLNLALVKVRKPFTSLSECIIEQCSKFHLF